MRTETIEIFTFNELTSEAQARAITAERNNENRLAYPWDEHDIDDATTYLGYMGFSDVKIAYSGFWSQGDGASFTGNFDSSNINLDKLKEHNPELYSAWGQALTKLASEKITATLYRKPSLYVHHNTVGIDEFTMPNYVYAVEQAEVELYEVKNNHSDNASIQTCQQQLDAVQAKCNSMYESYLGQLSGLRTSLCAKIYNTLEKTYEYLMTDDAIKDDLILNECEFTADGRPYF